MVRWALPLLMFAAAGAAAGELRDPTRPLTGTAAPAGGGETVEAAPRLSSTRTSAGVRVAVIDGRKVREGERVGDAEVAEIRPGTVTLRKGDQVFSVTILPDTMKRSTAGTHTP